MGATQSRPSSPYTPASTRFDDDCRPSSQLSSPRSESPASFTSPSPYDPLSNTESPCPLPRAHITSELPTSRPDPPLTPRSTLYHRNYIPPTNGITVTTRNSSVQITEAQPQASRSTPYHRSGVSIANPRTATRPKVLHIKKPSYDPPQVAPHTRRPNPKNSASTFQPTTTANTEHGTQSSSRTRRRPGPQPSGSRSRPSGNASTNSNINTSNNSPTTNTRSQAPPPMPRCQHFIPSHIYCLMCPESESNQRPSHMRLPDSMSTPLGPQPSSSRSRLTANTNTNRENASSHSQSHTRSSSHSQQRRPPSYCPHLIPSYLTCMMCTLDDNPYSRRSVQPPITTHTIHPNGTQTWTTIMPQPETEDEESLAEIPDQVSGSLRDWGGAYSAWVERPSHDQRESNNTRPRTHSEIAADEAAEQAAEAAAERGSERAAEAAVARQVAAREAREAAERAAQEAADREAARTAERFLTRTNPPYGPTPSPDHDFRRSPHANIQGREHHASPAAELARRLNIERNRYREAVREALPGINHALWVADMESRARHERVMREEEELLRMLGRAGSGGSSGARVEFHSLDMDEDAPPPPYERPPGYEFSLGELPVYTA